MTYGERWDGTREFHVPKQYRQRVRARRRSEAATKAIVESQTNTRPRMRGITNWLLRWLPWYATPEGGRI